jgi:hypothetical protein
MAGGSYKLIWRKPILSYNSLQNFLSKFYLLRVEITPKYYIVASYVALGATQQSWNNGNHHPSECMALSSCLRVSSQVLNHSERVMRFFHTFHD